MSTARPEFAQRKALTACVLGALTLIAPGVEAATRTVLNCADAGAGSLRAVVATAANADTIVFDTASMACSTISLTTGAIATSLDDLTLAGPGAGALTIDAGAITQVILHQGSGTLTVSGLTLQRGGYAALSGGCVAGHNVVLNDVAIKQCRALGNAIVARGGAVFASGDLHISNSKISQSGAISASGSGGDAFGGGAYAAGNAVVQGSTFYSDLANNGGGLFVLGNASITGSTFSNNSGGYIGGGLIVGGTAAITNTTVSSNSGYECGGIVSLSDMTLSNSTVAFNMSSSTLQPGRDGAGVCAAVAVTLQSSILAKNTRFVSGGGSVAADLSTTSGTTISGNNNLIMGTTAGTTAPGDTITLDPNLGPLLNSGGSTKVHAFNTNSPAAGVGNNRLRLASDQRGRGFARMTGEKTDIGAFQSGNGIFADGFE